jgi:hypothetical protein
MAIQKLILPCLLFATFSTPAITLANTEDAEQARQERRAANNPQRGKSESLSTQDKEARRTARADRGAESGSRPQRGTRERAGEAGGQAEAERQRRGKGGGQRQGKRNGGKRGG